MEQHYRRLQRATVARSALDVIAIIFLGCSFAFWGVAFWQLLAPPSVLSLWTIQAIVLALVYALATPLLWSMLVPTTPAGQLLQKTQWRTIGFAFIVAAAIYLSLQAEWMIEAWLTGQPAIAESGLQRSLAISLSIAFILIPALAWVQLTPERWLQQIQQAHQVKRLEMQQRGELAILKSRILWATQRAAVSYANLLPAEQKEIIDTMRGLFMSIGDTQRDIARTLQIDADLSRTILDDARVADDLNYVADALTAQEVTQPALPARTDETRALTRADDRAADPSERTERAPVAYTEPHKDRVSGRVAVRQGDAARDGDYTVAYEAFGMDEAWTVRDLAGVLKVAESTARERKIAWENAGLVSGRGLSNGRYRFVA